MNVIHKLFDCSIPLIITYFSGQQRILDTAPLSSYKLVMHLYPFTWNFTCSCSSSETIDSYKYTVVSHLEKNIKAFKLKKVMAEHGVVFSVYYSICKLTNITDIFDGHIKINLTKKDT